MVLNILGRRRNRISCRTNRIGCRLRRIGSRMSRTGCRMSRIGCMMSMIGCRRIRIKDGIGLTDETVPRDRLNYSNSKENFEITSSIYLFFFLKTQSTVCTQYYFYSHYILVKTKLDIIFLPEVGGWVHSICTQLFTSVTYPSEVGE